MNTQSTECCLITQWKHGEVVFGVALNGTEEQYIKKIKGSTYKYNLILYGALTEEIDEAYLVYSEGEYYAYHPKAVYIDKKQAEDFAKYWNDDAGIMATGEYQFIEKVKILK